MPDERREGTSEKVGAIKKNSQSDVVVSIGEFKGHQLLDIRVHTDTQSGRRPTKQGVAVGIGHAARLKDLIGDAITLARARGWL